MDTPARAFDGPDGKHWVVTRRSAMQFGAGSGSPPSREEGLLFSASEETRFCRIDDLATPTEEVLQIAPVADLHKWLARATRHA